MPDRPSVYIAYTGGTIGMKRSSGGYVPYPGFLARQMAQMPEFQSAELPRYTINEYTPLLDSSNMTPDSWVTIASDIIANYDRYDGFIVLHGTDTMAYSASALSFMLEQLGKPVIITGSQIPLIELRNDARDNLIAALLIAGRYPIPEVCLYFNHQLLRGNRAQKVDADGFRAFASANYPPLGLVGIDIEISWSLVRPRPETAVRLQPLARPLIGSIRLFPGISAAILRGVLQQPLQGLVLETYGVGNAPDQDAEFLATLAEATARGVVIVNCTQCLRGTVNMGGYATGNALRQAGVISGYDMTPEAALTKLFYLFSRQLPVDQIKALLETDLRGELTAPSAPRAPAMLEALSGDALGRI
jgi:L-asparaginase